MQVGHYYLWRIIMNVFMFANAILVISLSSHCLANEMFWVEDQVEPTNIGTPDAKKFTTYPTTSEKRIEPAIKEDIANKTIFPNQPKIDKFEKEKEVN
jgi:hypothetical protein